VKVKLGKPVTAQLGKITNNWRKNQRGPTKRGSHGVWLLK